MPFSGGAALGPVQTSIAVWLILLLSKGLVLLLLAEAALRLARQSSASVRHLIRVSSLAALLTLPALAFWGPRWELDWLETAPQQAEPPSDSVLGAALEGGDFAAASPLPEAAEARLSEVSATIPPDSRPAAAASSITRAGVSKPTTTEWAWPGWQWLLPAIWALGVIILCLRLLLGIVCVQLAIRRAEPVQDGLWLDLAYSAASRLSLQRPVKLVIGKDVEVALSVGLWRAFVLLPEVARTWSLPRRRSILLHELAHVKRHDNLSNLAGQLACILHWPNPLVWLASRGMVVEREQACDDEVLAAGATPSEYASHLLEIARAVSRRRFWGRLEISQSSALKERFKALLDPRMARSLPGTAGKLTATFLSAALLLPVAAFHPWKAASPRVAPLQAPAVRNAGFVNSADYRPEPTFAESPTGLAGFTAGAAEIQFASAATQPPGPQSPPEHALAGPPDRDIADHRAWPLTQVITSGAHLSPVAQALWSQGPPHRIWGVNRDAFDAPSPPPTALRTPLRVGSFTRRTETPQTPGPIQRPPAPTEPKVTVERVDLGTLGGDESQALDINEAGMVVGRSKLPSGLVRPFLWSKQAGMADLGLSLQSHTRAVKINSGGRILCETFDAREYRGYLWSLEGGLTDIGALSAKRPFTVPSALNAHDRVVGGSRDEGGMLRAFLWTAAEGMLDLGTSDWSEALAVNDWDQVVGYTGAQAFLWDRSHGVALIGPEGSSLSIATDINNRGQVVGYAHFGGDFPQAFVWTPRFGAVPLGPVDPEYPISFALSISDQGQVLGRRVADPREGAPQEVRLFRWTAESGIEDLGPIEEQDQFAINALGHIVTAYQDATGGSERSVATIWTQDGQVRVELDEGAGGSSSQVNAVNSRGQLVGSSLSPQGERRATLWDVRVTRE